jgi:hypothetical protein
VIVSYCDGTLKVWTGTNSAREFESLNNLDGCLFTHTGFHPHTLSSTKMAFVREVNGRVLEVKEKASFTDNPFAEHASSGVYYFRRGEYLKKYAQEQIDQGITHNGEFYVTLMYNLLIKDGLNVGYFDTEFFACLGTPEEVRNFEAWSTIVRNPHLRTPHGVANCYHYWSGYWNENNTLDAPTESGLCDRLYDLHFMAAYGSRPKRQDVHAVGEVRHKDHSTCRTAARTSSCENVLAHINMPRPKSCIDINSRSATSHVRQNHRRGGQLRRVSGGQHAVDCCSWEVYAAALAMRPPRASHFCPEINAVLDTLPERFVALHIRRGRQGAQ